MTAQQHAPGSPLDCCIAAPSASLDCRNPLKEGVSEILQAEQELDDAICELGIKSEAAMAAGDKAGARELSDRMYAAIKSRTPEHQARLTAELEQRIDDGLCFFGSDAAVAMGQLGKAPA